MSGESPTAGPTAETAEAEESRDSSLLSALARIDVDGDRAALWAGGAALTVVAAGLAVRIAHNAPFDPLAVPAVVFDALAVGTPLVLGAALFAVALTTTDPTRRVGLLFAGAFGPLATISPAATLPAVAGVIGGGALALVGSLERPTTYREGRRAAVVVGFVVAVAVSLSRAVGLLDAGMTVGAGLALVATAALALLVRVDRVAALAGLAAAGTLVAAAVTMPYLAGSVLLVGLGVVGVPQLLVALALGGGVAAAVAGLREGVPLLAVGALLIVLAGVPAALPRVMAVLLGVALVTRATAQRPEVRA
ncbi:phosphate ABC transporter permease [Halorientalis pallida]|uniref:phosphate ABC transporter permease n=1 Tax=Halorientalis pallida TaxID=2479928 RepID=UPI003C6EAD88